MKSTSSPSNLGLISSKDAAQHAGFTHDYISRLCRFGKVKGEKIGNTWYIDKESLDEFLLKQQTKREVRKHELSEERKIEYLEPGIFISTKKKEILGVRKIPDAEASKFSSRVVKEFFTIDENVKGSISDFDFLKAKYVAVAIALLCTFGFSSFAFSESKYFALARTHALDTFAPLVVVGSYMGNVATGVFSERENIFVDPVVSTASVFSSTISFLTSTFDGVSSRTKLAFETVLSTRPEKALGDVKLWDTAEKALASALNTNKLKYNVAKGEGAFYGPKIDFKVKDAIGRTWQLATIQLDFNLPLRFNATYEGSDGKKHTPVMIHRAIFGSLERFIAVMTEHFAGKFPLWLSPVQIRLMTVTDRAVKFAEEVKDLLSKSNVRAELDARTETIPKKVRDAQMDYIPLMVTVGDKEVDNKTLAVRTLDGKVKFGVKPNEFLELVKSNIEERKLEIKL